MSFLNASLLTLGTLSIAVPILIHLLNRRKYERVVWAAMRFLKASVEQNQRRIQIEDMLLLLLRCLLLVLLGLALSRPTFGCSQGMLGQGSVTAVIVLDNSYSMSATDGVKSRFEQAKMAADQVVSTMPSGSSVAVLLASDIATAVIPEPTHDLLKVRRSIGEARLSGRPSNLYPAVRAAIDTLRGRSALRKEIYLLTDGQLVAWKQLNEIRTALDAEKADNVKTSVIFVGAKEDQNLGISDLRRTTGVVAVGREIRFEAEITNYGTVAADHVPVSLRIDSDPPIDQQMIDDIPAGQHKAISLTAKFRDEGFHIVTASIPADHLPADDTRIVAVRAVKEVKVLLVDGNPSRDFREAESSYLRAALMPIAPGTAASYFLKPTVVTGAELDQQKFDLYDMVAFCDVADCSQRTLDSLASYLRRGGGLVIFPGPNTHANFYNERMGAEYHFLPATLGKAVGDDDTNRRDKFFSIQPKGYDHPIVDLWSRGSPGSPSEAHFWKAYELTPATDTVKDAEKTPDGGRAANFAAEAGLPRIVMKYGVNADNSALDDKPAVMERTWGMGRVFLFSSTASDKWTDWPFTGSWLIFVDRVVNAVITRQDDSLNIKVGDPFVYHPSEDLIGKEALIYHPGQKEEATDSRRVEATKSGSASISYDGVDVPGEYVAKFPGESQENNPSIKFAAQTDTDANESSLEELNQTQRDTLGQVANVTHWQPGDQLGPAIEKQRVGTELWLPIAIVVLALAATEMFLAHWFSRTK